MGFHSPIGTAEAFAAGRGKPQGCGLRVRKAGCRISPDPKPDAISRGHREAAVTSGGAGVARGAAASPPWHVRKRPCRVGQPTFSERNHSTKLTWQWESGPLPKRTTLPPPPNKNRPQRAVFLITFGHESLSAYWNTIYSSYFMKNQPVTETLSEITHYF